MLDAIVSRTYLVMLFLALWSQFTFYLADEPSGAQPAFVLRMAAVTQFCAGPIVMLLVWLHARGFATFRPREFLAFVLAAVWFVVGAKIAADLMAEAKRRGAVDTRGEQ